MKCFLRRTPVLGAAIIVLILAFTRTGECSSFGTQMGAIITTEAVIEGEVNGQPIAGSGEHIGDPWHGTNSGTLVFTEVPMMVNTRTGDPEPFIAPGMSTSSLLSWKNIIITDEDKT